MLEAHLKNIAQRLLKLKNGEFASLWEESTILTQGVVNRTDPSVDARAQEAAACLAAGAIGEAMMQVAPEGHLATDTVVRERLPGLFPSGTVPQRPNMVFGENDQEDFLNNFDKELLKTPKRGAPGPGGMRFDHIRAISHDPAAVRALARACLIFATGKAPHGAHVALAWAKIMPLAKPGRKVRPIAIGCEG